MHGDERRTGCEKIVQIPVGVGDHEVDVKGHGRCPAKGFHHRRPDGEIGDKMAVHHVHMDKVGARLPDQPRAAAWIATTSVAPRSRGRSASAAASG